MPVVSLALCIVVAYNTPTLDNVHKRVFVTVWLVMGGTNFPHPNFCNVAIYIRILFVPYKPGLHLGYDTPMMLGSQPGNLQSSGKTWNTLSCKNPEKGSISRTAIRLRWTVPTHTSATASHLTLTPKPPIIPSGD